MCGLVGMAGSIGRNEKDAFRYLLVVDTLRGPHSTGMACVDTQGNWDLVKKQGTPYDLFDSKQFTTAFSKTSYVLIGHNRYATQGKVNSQNAHPFEFRDVVGAHNGTLRGQHRLPDHTRFEVDSENIFYTIQEEGVDSTLQKLDGSYALTYWDKRTEELTIIRNDERELFYCLSKDNKTIFWASESWMLYACLHRASIKHGPVTAFDKETIYRIKVERKFKPSDVEIHTEKYEEPFFARSYGKGYNWGDYHGGSSGKKQDNSQSSSSNTSKNTSKNASKKAQEAVGKKVDFTISGADTTAYGQPYLSGELVTDPDIKVRVFATQGTRIWENLSEKDVSFTGIVSSLVWDSGKNSFLLNMKLSSIEETGWVDEEEDEVFEGNTPNLYKGFEGALLTEKQFENQVKKGCSWCASPLFIKDAESIKWAGHYTPLCSSCQDQPEVVEILKG